MKKTVLSLALLFFGIVNLNAQTGQSIELKGVYQGENLYVLNPFAQQGVGFCIYEVTVNGQVASDEINSSSFEIDFAPYSLNRGDELRIIIKHKDGCSPRILNEDVLKPKSTFNITAIKIDKDGVLQWSTIDENGSLAFEIQQFRWNKWVAVGEVEGVGTPTLNNYTFNLFDSKLSFQPHSGKNKYRVKQSDYRGRPRYSIETTYMPIKITEVTQTSTKIVDKLTFSAATSYEVFDAYGQLVLRGFGAEANITKLPKGDYYLNYDAKPGEKFSKR